MAAPLDREGTAVACAVDDVDYKVLMSVRRAVQQGSKRCSGLLPGHLTRDPAGGEPQGTGQSATGQGAPAESVYNAVAVGCCSGC